MVRACDEGNKRQSSKSDYENEHWRKRRKTKKDKTLTITIAKQA